MKNSTRGLVTIEGITIDKAFIFWVTMIRKLDDSFVLKSTGKETERTRVKNEKEGKDVSEERKGIS